MGRHSGHRYLAGLVAAVVVGAGAGAGIGTGGPAVAAPAGNPPPDPTAAPCARGEGNTGRITAMTAEGNYLVVSGWVRYCRPYRGAADEKAVTVLATVGWDPGRGVPSSWGSPHQYPDDRVRRHFSRLRVLAAPLAHHTCLYAATAPLDCWFTSAGRDGEYPRVVGPSPARPGLARHHGAERPNCGTCW